MLPEQADRSVVLELILVLVTPTQQTGLLLSQSSRYFEKSALLRLKKLAGHASNLLQSKRGYIGYFLNIFFTSN